MKMPNKQEKEIRKKLMEEITRKNQIEFEKNLPMDKEIFKELFNYLDEELSKNNCDGTNKIAKNYLEAIGKNDIDNILEWLAKNGGYCDCEILANVEELFM
jgi:redox-regulated HSP33 family molecular chaperone